MLDTPHLLRQANGHKDAALFSRTWGPVRLLRPTAEVARAVQSECLGTKTPLLCSNKLQNTGNQLLYHTAPCAEQSFCTARPAYSHSTHLPGNAHVPLFFEGVTLPSEAAVTGH